MMQTKTENENSTQPGENYINQPKISLPMFQRPLGTRDFYPEETAYRERLFDLFREVATRYGYGEIETPAFEDMRLLTAKSGEAIEKEIFVLEKRGDERYGLRFDLTVPAVRMLVQKQKELVKPVKWFCCARMWRYERPQRGRLREFYQMGAELFGSAQPEADAECISLAADFLLKTGLKENDITVFISNRKLLEGLLRSIGIADVVPVIRLIDKSRKISEEEFGEELKKAGLGEKQVKEVKALLQAKEIADFKKFKLNDEAKRGLEELQQVLAALKLFGREKMVQINLAIARGFDYYTGTIFECFDAGQSLRSIFAGGRYDNLIEQFGGQPTPATGFAIGDATLQLLLEEKGLWVRELAGVDYYLAILGNEEVKKFAFELARKLRAKEYAVAIDLVGRNLGNQMNYANKIRARNVIVIGENELGTRRLTVKNMVTGEEREVRAEDLGK